MKKNLARLCLESEEDEPALPPRLEIMLLHNQEFERVGDNGIDRTPVIAISKRRPNLTNLPTPRQHQKLPSVALLPHRIRTPQSELESRALPINVKKDYSESSLSHFDIIIRNIRRQSVRVELDRNKELMNKIIYNDKGHIVALFKESLIFDEPKEVLSDFYVLCESKSRISVLAKYAKKYSPCLFQLKERRILTKAGEKKEKIKKIKCEEDDEKGDEESTFLRTGFMNSLAKEDLSNSLSRLPANSLECSSDEDCNKIMTLLSELNEKDASVLRKEKGPAGKKKSNPTISDKALDRYKGVGKTNRIERRQPVVPNLKPAKPKCETRLSSAKLLAQLKGLTLNLNTVATPRLEHPPPPPLTTKHATPFHHYFNQQPKKTKEFASGSSLSKASHTMGFGTTFDSMLTTTNKAAGVSKIELPLCPRPLNKLSLLATKKVFLHVNVLPPKKQLNKNEGMEPRGHNKASTSIGVYGKPGILSPRLLLNANIRLKKEAQCNPKVTITVDMKKEQKETERFLLETMRSPRPACSPKLTNGKGIVKKTLSGVPATVSRCANFKYILQTKYVDLSKKL